MAEVDRRCIDDDVDRAALVGAVERDAAGGLGELAAPDRDAEMANLEARVGVVRLDIVGLGEGRRKVSVARTAVRAFSFILMYLLLGGWDCLAAAISSP
ncbi:MAG: hypothetical protein M5R42_03780 [Rhodocyclaceae bacterium]|nr:hypothetical protein [Rhodocyclaceae bacterium]